MDFNANDITDRDKRVRPNECRYSGWHTLNDGDCTCIKCGEVDHSPCIDWNHDEQEFREKYPELSYAGACSHCGKTKVNYARDGETPCYKCDGKGTAKPRDAKPQSPEISKEDSEKCPKCEGTGVLPLKNMLHTVWGDPNELENLNNSLK